MHCKPFFDSNLTALSRRVTRFITDAKDLDILNVEYTEGPDAIVKRYRAMVYYTRKDTHEK